MIQTVATMALFIFIGSERVEAANFVYEKRGRDPFRPLITDDGKLVQGFDGISLEDIDLEGIIWDPQGGSVAMINGMILRRGDRIGDFEIVKIEKDRITLKSGSEQRLLKLEKNF